MKFDLTSLIITVIALLAFIIPVTFDQKNKRKTTKIKKHILKIAKKHKLNVDSSNVFQNAYALGLDTNMKKMVYLKNDGTESTEEIYDLSKVSNCRLHHSDITEVDSEFRKIGFLRLQFQGAKKQPLDVLVYKMKQNLSYTEEETQAKKIVKAVNSLL